MFPAPAQRQRINRIHFYYFVIKVLEILLLNKNCIGLILNKNILFYNAFFLFLSRPIKIENKLSSVDLLCTNLY